jgi:pimeloyl-ACP methyl ester carboxylesterase
MKNAIPFRRIGTSICVSIFSLVAIFGLGQAVPGHGEQVPLGDRDNSVPATSASKMPPVIVIGFVGGFIKHDDPVHSEVQLAARLRKAYPEGVDVETFESYNGRNAVKKILSLLDTNHDGTLTLSEKQNARIILCGHSWGGSAAIAVARDLEKLASLCSSPFKWIVFPRFTRMIRSSPRTWPGLQISASPTDLSTARPPFAPPIQHAQKYSGIFDSNTQRAHIPATSIPRTTTSS